MPNDRYKSPGELIHLLVDIVSKGGNFLLNIGPSAEGEFDPNAHDRLEKIGEWMKVNGEAIYNSRPIAPFKDGKVCLTKQGDGSVYAVYLADADEPTPPQKIWLSGIRPASGATVTLLGFNGQLKWEKVGKGFIVDIPESVRHNPPCQYAWTLKISAVEK